MHIARSYFPFFLSTHKMLKRVRLRATAWGISDSQPRIFRAGGYKGRDLRQHPTLSPPQTIFLVFPSCSVHRYIYVQVNIRTHTFVHKYSLIVQPMRACILRDKSASSLCQSAVTRFAPVGMRESCRLCKVVGGKVLTFDVAQLALHSWQRLWLDLVLCVILGYWYSILALIRYGYKHGQITVAEISSVAISVLMRIFRIIAMSTSPPVTNYKCPTLSSLLQNNNSQ